MQGSIPSIRGVHVESGPFAQGRNFRLFCDDSNGAPCRASIVFGRNGSGKTTLSREIAGIASGTSTGGYLYGADGKAVPLSEGERARIRVFNEDYVREKVLVEADGVESIVMLGEQADAKKKINEIDEELVELGKQFEEQQGVRDRLESGRESIANLEKAAKTAAKDGGWADRRAAIDGGRPSLTTARWDAILASETKEPRKALQDEFDRKLTELGRAEAAGSAIAGRVPALDPSLFDEDGLVTLLSKKLDEPVLTDRERRIMSLVQEGHQEIVETARDVFSRGETTVCPMCQRELTPEYRESLEESILRVLSDAVDAYRADLDRARIPEINEDAVALGDVPEELLVGYRKALAAANAIISSYERMVGERLGAIYSQVETAPLGLAGAIAALNAEAAAANEEIDSINASVRDRDALRGQLLGLADQIAWLDAKDEIAALDSAKAELSAAKEKLDEIDGRRRKLNADLNRERTRMAMTNIAAETINSFLANVYFDTGRFVLVPEGDVYKIRSRGKPVRPQDVSAGERNVLALCYFFSESGRGRSEGSEDADPQYIVLDDPISSFDVENEIGICSLMRERFEGILTANEESRVTVMTHSLNAFQETERILCDLKETLKTTNAGKFNYKVYRLTQGGTEDYVMKRSEYQSLLKRAYDFASSEAEDEAESYVIGNVLRRIVEGYSTFNYGIAMEMLARDPALVGRMGPVGKALSGVMYRLALNDESHLKDRVASLSPTASFEPYSYDEKRAMARCVLVMLSRLDPYHVVRHLRNFGVSSSEVQENVRRWEEPLERGTDE